MKDMDELKVVKKVEMEVVLAMCILSVTFGTDFDKSVVSFSGMDLGLIDLGGIVVENVGPVLNDV